MINSTCYIVPFPQDKYSPLWLGLESWLKISFPEVWGWEWRKSETISSVLALIHFSVFTMVLPGRAYVHEYVRRNLSNLWLSNWRRKKLKKKGSQFIWKYFYSENCFKYHYPYLKKNIYLFEEKGSNERSSHCLFLCLHGWRLEDHRVRKKIKLPEILLGVGQLKRKKLNTETIHDVWLSEWNLTLHSNLLDCKNRSISAKFV